MMSFTLRLLSPLKRFYRRHRKAVRVLLALAFAGGLTLLLAFGAFFYSVTSDLPDVDKLDEYDPAQTSKIFSRDGTLIATLYEENRTYVPYEKIAPVMVEALVAVEDRRFFEHSGVDLRGIARAAVGNILGGEIEQGASTLTMQLARGLFLSTERTYSRKLREAVLAYRIDHTLSKEKILELYLNEVYFGAGAYGIDAAASLYFQKQPDELGLWEASLLAGLVQAPSAYSPINDKEAALARQEDVLNAMIANGTTTEAEASLAQRKAREHTFPEQPLATSGGMLKYPYFSTYAIRQLSQDYPENYLRRGGLKIVTTLDTAIQDSAERHLRAVLASEGSATGADAGAVVVLDNETGEIVAMVGGQEWSTRNQFNRAWQAKRQPGSAFKMFVYAAALEAGYTPEQEFADTESVFNPDQPNRWKPSNSDGKFMGAIPMRSGLQFSRNVVAAKVLAHVGPERVITLARSMGIESELPAVISLALGAGEVTPLQMARAYSSLPNGGVLKATRALRLVEAEDGEVMADHRQPEAERRVMNRETATVMCEMLRRVVTAGTGTSANRPDTFVAGKTGTTDQFIDAWFVGFTPHHTIAVWIGRDDNKPMNRVFGGTLPARIFSRVAGDALQGRNPAAALPAVELTGGTNVELCWDSTYPALPECSRTYTDTFRTRFVPERRCPIHRQMKVKMTAARLAAMTADSSSAYGPGGVPTDPSEAVISEPVAEEGTMGGLELESQDDPRQDPEVVTSATARIPYIEEEPEVKGKLTITVEDKEEPSEGLEVEADADERYSEMIGEDSLESPTVERETELQEQPERSYPQTRPEEVPDLGLDEEPSAAAPPPRPRATVEAPAGPPPTPAPRPEGAPRVVPERPVRGR